MPKVQLGILLLLIGISTIVRYPALTGLRLIGLSVAFCVLFDELFFFMKKRTWFPSYAAAVTGCIIGLLVSPDAAWWQLALISFLAISSKLFLRLGAKILFNPAAFGLVAAGLLLGLPVSWWGVSFQLVQGGSVADFLLFALLVSPLLVSGGKLRRFPAIAGFVFTYSVLSHGFRLPVSWPLIAARAFDPTVLFFAGVMLPEPRTSPVRFGVQILYGVFVAVVALFLAPISALPDTFAAALLLGNIVFLKIRSVS